MALPQSIVQALLQRQKIDEARRLRKQQALAGGLSALGMGVGALAGGLGARKEGGLTPAEGAILGGSFGQLGGGLVSYGVAPDSGLQLDLKTPLAALGQLQPKPMPKEQKEAFKGLGKTVFNQVNPLGGIDAVQQGRQQVFGQLGGQYSDLQQLEPNEVVLRDNAGNLVRGVYKNEQGQYVDKSGTPVVFDPEAGTVVPQPTEEGQLVAKAASPPPTQQEYMNSLAQSAQALQQAYTNPQEPVNQFLQMQQNPYVQQGYREAQSAFVEKYSDPQLRVELQSKAQRQAEEARKELDTIAKEVEPLFKTETLIDSINNNLVSGKPLDIAQQWTLLASVAQLAGAGALTEGDVANLGGMGGVAGMFYRQAMSQAAQLGVPLAVLLADKFGGKQTREVVAELKDMLFGGEPVRGELLDYGTAVALTNYAKRGVGSALQRYRERALAVKESYDNFRIPFNQSLRPAGITAPEIPGEGVLSTIDELAAKYDPEFSGTTVNFVNIPSPKYLERKLETTNSKREARRVFDQYLDTIDQAYDKPRQYMVYVASGGGDKIDLGLAPVTGANVVGAYLANLYTLANGGMTAAAEATAMKQGVAIRGLSPAQVVKGVLNLRKDLENDIYRLKSARDSIVAMNRRYGILSDEEIQQEISKIDEYLHGLDTLLRGGVVNGTAVPGLMDIASLVERPDEGGGSANITNRVINGLRQLEENAPALILGSTTKE